ncbi:hypothetical protein ACFQ1S_00780 [Kibdelosporangium lantanae]|uniref:Uncharacterized protein n=1 Tax=Kibdelosporangium lantanae TaxID=1497396 RepID=A0ABW3M1S5_9PSEU
MRKRLRPGAAWDTGERLKLHRREMRLDGREFVVVSPRPGTEVRFSTNYFHGTWHILSDLHGARFLARLMWGLAYQRRAGTVVVVDQDFIDPEPFGGAPGFPFVLVPSNLTHLTTEALKQLKRQLPLRKAPDGTVRWHTPGLGRAEVPRIRQHDRVVAEFYQMYGLVVFAAAPALMRVWADYTHTLGENLLNGMDYTELDNAWRDGGWGEVQIFTDYHRRVSAARVARAELRTELGAEPDEETVWDRGEEVRGRRGYL